MRNNGATPPPPPHLSPPSPPSGSLNARDGARGRRPSTPLEAGAKSPLSPKGPRRSGGERR